MYVFYHERYALRSLLFGGSALRLRCCHCSLQVPLRCDYENALLGYCAAKPVMRGD